MIFHLGSLPKEDKTSNFQLHGKYVKNSDSFKYLGFIFTQQLSFTKHLNAVTAKAHSKIGQIFNKLKNFNGLSMELAIMLFKTYVLPCYSYGEAIWYGSTSKDAIIKMNRTFTKYLKRYLGIPNTINNEALYFLTDSVSVDMMIKSSLENSKDSVNYQIERILADETAKDNNVKEYQCKKCSFACLLKKALISI